MKIKRVKILSPFRGLPKNYEIIFNKDILTKKGEISPICFVGLNGSGKSNALEVIAEIFYYLETLSKVEKENISKFNSPFGFEIEYELPREYLFSIRINEEALIPFLEKSQENPTIEAIKNINQLPEISVLNAPSLEKFQIVDHSQISGILPARIVAYSSGMNELLSNPFIKIDFDYYNDLTSLKKLKSDLALDVNRLFYLNYDSNKFITICNFIFDADDFDMSNFIEGQKATDFGGIDLRALKRELLIKNIRSFRISFRLKKLKKENDFKMHSNLNIALVKLKNCATFINEENYDTKNENQVNIELVFWVNKATKEAFRNNFKTAYELYRTFYFFQLLNTELISKKTRQAISSAKAGSYENLSDELPKHEASKLNFQISGLTFYTKDKVQLQYRKFSDGEHQLLQVIGSLLLLDTIATLFLFDEPETHFNPEWRSKFVQLLHESIENERSQEIILTTHSPYIVSDCKKEQVYIFQKEANGLVKLPVNPKINTFGTSIGILSDVVFGKEDTISELSKKKIQEISSMSMESLDDIQKAKEASRVLGESVEKVLLFKEIITRENELIK